MILDRARVDAYAAAIASVVKPGDVVMDMGSGSGLLALLAARAGARKVYAIERTEAHAFVRAHAKENGFEGVIEVVHADWNDEPAAVDRAITLKPDVVVAEVLGNFAPEEGQHSAFRRARALAKPGATFVPESYALLFAPSVVDYIEPSARELADVHGLRMEFLAQRLSAWPLTARVDADDLCGDERIGWRGPTTGPEPSEIAVTLPITRDCVVRSIVSGFTVKLAPGVEITTSIHAAATHWKSVAFPLEAAIECFAGDTLEFRLVLPEIVWRHTWRWTATRRRP
jgi:hypothetical protein